MFNSAKTFLLLTLFLGTVLLPFCVAVPANYLKLEEDPTFREFQNYSPTKRAPNAKCPGGSCDNETGDTCDGNCYCYKKKCYKMAEVASRSPPIKNKGRSVL